MRVKAKKPLNAIEMQSKVNAKYLAPLQQQKEVLKKSLKSTDYPSGKYPKGTYKYSSTMRRITRIDRRMEKISRALDKKLAKLN